MGGPNIIQPEVPKAPTAGQSAAEYAAALPSIMNAQLQYQPQFDQATFDSYAKLAPEYARVSQQALEEHSPNQAALPEALAAQALEGSTQGLTQQLRDSYLDTYKSLAGENVSAGVGADFVGQQLLNQDLAYRQHNQNLALSLGNRMPVSQAYQNPSSFQVANQFGNQYGQAMGAYGSVYSGAGRPIQGPSGIDQFAKLAGGIGGLLKGAGSAAAGFGAG